MRGYHGKVALLGSVAMLALMPVQAAAQTSKQAELEARLKALEESVGSLRAELDAERQRNAQLQQNQQQTEQKVQAIQTAAAVPPPPPPAPTDGFRVGGTTVKLNGFIRTTAAFSRWDDGDVAGNSLGRDFYLPQSIPVGGTRESTDYDFSAKQTRLWLTTATPVGKHKLGGHIEFDFQTSPGTQGSERTTNGYNLALRRGFITFDNLLAGQEWSNFQYVAALPESTDFVGATEGTVFVRQPQIRYTHKLGETAALSVSAENPETASATTASAALTEQDDDRMPDFTARLLLKPRFGEFSLAGLLRQLSVDNGTASARGTGWGISGAGKIPFGPDKRHNISFMATYGSGIGRYVGLNFAPDAIVYAHSGGGIDLAEVRTFAGFAAARIGITPTLRGNIIYSMQNVDYPAAYRPIGANESAWSAAANLFWSPVKGFDIGAEYRHGVREIWVLSGGVPAIASGQLDRIEFAFKYSF